MACLIALLSIPSMVMSCRSLKIPRWVACYLDFRSFSTTIILYVGLSFRLVNCNLFCDVLGDVC